MSGNTPQLEGSNGIEPNGPKRLIIVDWDGPDDPLNPVK
jgi:hypothetical protein